MTFIADAERDIIRFMIYHIARPTTTRNFQAIAYRIQEISQ